MTVDPVRTVRRPASSRRLSRFARQFFAKTSARISVACLTLLVLVTLAGPWITPQNPYDLTSIDFLDGRLPPGSESATGMIYHLGTDNQGRDMLSAIIYGLKISLGVGVLSALAAAAIGGSIGLFVAYKGGRIEGLVMRLVDLQLSFPTILVALMILAFLGEGIFNVVLAIILVEWATYARMARGATLVEKKKEYVEAAECLAVPTRRIIFRHMLPNVVPALIVIATLQVARAISLEATLSFLGLGVPVTEPSLGLLIANGYQYMLSGQYWISFYPGVALVLTVVLINLVGDRLREVLNPKGAK
nr:ABC transporter permease [Acuticoccus kandeliae]